MSLVMGLDLAEISIAISVFWGARALQQIALSLKQRSDLERRVKALEEQPK